MHSAFTIIAAVSGYHDPYFARVCRGYYVAWEAADAIILLLFLVLVIVGTTVLYKTIDIACFFWSHRTLTPRPKPSPQAICRHCGYDLRASVDRCPECGNPIPPPPRRPRRYPIIYRGYVGPTRHAPPPGV